MQKYQAWIDGQWVDPASGEWFETENPYTAEAWALIPRCNAEDADRAVQAAYNAYDKGPWADMTATGRGALLRKLGDLLSENAEWLADIEVRDNGNSKPKCMAKRNTCHSGFITSVAWPTRLKAQ